MAYWCPESNKTSLKVKRGHKNLFWAFGAFLNSKYHWNMLDNVPKKIQKTRQIYLLRNNARSYSASSTCKKFIKRIWISFVHRVYSTTISSSENHLCCFNLQNRITTVNFFLPSKPQNSGRKYKVTSMALKRDYETINLFLNKIFNNLIRLFRFQSDSLENSQLQLNNTLYQL